MRAWFRQRVSTAPPKTRQTLTITLSTALPPFTVLAAQRSSLLAFHSQNLPRTKHRIINLPSKPKNAKMRKFAVPSKRGNHTLEWPNRFGAYPATPPTRSARQKNAYLLETFTRAARPGFARARPRHHKRAVSNFELGTYNKNYTPLKRLICNALRLNETSNQAQPQPVVVSLRWRVRGRRRRLWHRNRRRRFRRVGSA